MSTNNPMGLKPGYLNWWQSLILAFACTLAGVIGAVAATTGGIKAPDGTVSSWVVDLLKLVPHAMMLFGLMADAVTYDGVYWSSTIVGLSAMPLHATLESILGGLIKLGDNMQKGMFPGGDATAANAAAPAAAVAVGTQTGQGRMFGGASFTGCTILGGTIAGPHRTAESLVVTASIVAYFFIDLWLNRGIINGIGILVLGTVLMGGQAMAISDCFKPGDKSLTAGILYAMVFGVIIGGSWFSFFQAFYPMYLPSTVIPLSNTISATTESGFVYVPGVGLVSATSPAGQQAIAQGKALSPDDMMNALETTGTVGTGAPGQAATCS
jgi:hypothetical protein